MRSGITAVLFLFAAPALAQEDLTVLKPQQAEASPRKMLSTYLLAEAQKHFDTRRAAIAKLQTPEDVHRRQQELRARFIAAIGGFPERTPLNARVVGTEQRDGYRIERVVYESRPHHHVTATLYLPDGKPPYPGVLMPIGHSATGKAAEYVQRGCILLAKNGLAALAYDPIGQGERNQVLDGMGKPFLSSTSEHTMVGVGALLVGRSTASYRIWDGIRSLDYLVSRQEIDPKRIGCTGCSGGGTMTSYLMALDERILAAAPSCYLTTLERLFATIGPQDAEQNITGQVAFGMEHADYIGLRAPRPTLICAASRDFFDIQGTWTTFREAKMLYGLLGHGERVDLVEYNTPHGYPRQQREAVVRWMRRWLLDKDDAPVEEPFAVAKTEALWCMRTGQVLEDQKGKSVFDLNAEKEKELAQERSKRLAERTSADLLRDVRRHLALSAQIGAARVRPLGEVTRDSCTIRKLAFETEPGITVPALHFKGRKAEASQPLVIYLNGSGKAEDAGAGGPIEKLIQQGKQVLALDLRGIGETAPGVASGKGPNYFGVEFKEIFLSLHIDRPLLGQRVHDVLSIVEQLSNDPGTAKTSIEIVGIGTSGPIALHAAALEPRLRRVTIERSVQSWSAVVRTPISHNQLTNVVPGVLQAYDLPDLAATIAPRPLTIRNPVDPTGKPVSP